MYNFYQSDIRKHISQNIFHKPFCTVILDNKEHMVILWEKKIGPIRLQRAQLLGVTWKQEDRPNRWRKQLIPQFRKLGIHPFFVQIGFLNIVSITPYKFIGNEQYGEEIRRLRLQRNTKLQNLGFLYTHKENLPPSTFLKKISPSLEEIISSCKNKYRTKYRKAVGEGAKWHIATPEQREEFYTVWKGTAHQKDFSIPSKENYMSLMKYLHETNNGALFITTHNGNTISGAIYLFDHINKTGIYLYGGMNREYHITGSNQFLHISVFDYLRTIGMTHVDLLGGEPSGFPEHPLRGVGEFKEGFGGEKIDILGSRDIPLNRFLYRLRKLYR